MQEKIQLTTLCFVIKDNKIVLLERQNTWYENMKYLPAGGNVDDGEDVKEAAVRELHEETGLVTDPNKLKLIHEYSSEFNGRKFYSYYFLATECSGTLTNREPERHSNAGWFPIEDLPANTSQVVYDTLNRL